ncbi:MAG: hypothetical protein HQL12_00560 [Candidatus Omnitrophica bacterium]|nr:hypothetical protein [Candidatus Omnitrophota bacterium]
MDEHGRIISSIEEGEARLKNALFEAEKKLKQGCEQAAKLASDIDKKTHENPWPVVAGVGIGCLLLGLLIGKSRD